MARDARVAAHRMRGLLFASVSHDLKSPLNAVLGFAELVGQGELTEAQRESLDLIQTRGRELLGLIETILDAARVEAGQLELSPRHGNVSRLVAEAVRKARELAGEFVEPFAFFEPGEQCVRAFVCGFRDLLIGQLFLDVVANLLDRFRFGFLMLIQTIKAAFDAVTIAVCATAVERRSPFTGRADRA